ncbi:MAG: DNA polymerase III subunit delta' [Burkholderiaceae bacterium]
MSQDATLAPWLQAQLTQLLRQRGHARYLEGPSGLGQYELALALVKAWLCETPTETGACGTCRSCHLVDTRAHPDLSVLMPETVALELGWPLSEKAQKDIDDKSRKPSKEIRVDAMRDTVGFAQRTSARGRGMAVLVYPAERMNTETANTLLKTLEEPAGDTRLVLACEATHQMLPTVRSRCQAHAMVWPEEADAVDWLAATLGAQSPGEAALRTCLRAVGGRPAQALGWIKAGWDPRQWGALPAAMAKGDWSLLAKWSPDQQLDVMQKLCHDLMALGSNASPRYFDRESLPATAPRWGVLARWSRDLMQAARSVEHPFSAGLMQEAWAARARDVLAPEKRTT